MAIEVRGLTKVFTTGRRGSRREIEAVRSLTLDVAPGERLAYIGPNGAGKSTSIKILTGILHPTSGEARVLGLVPWEERQRLAQRIGTLFGQRSLLWLELAPRQSYRMLAAIYGLDRAAERRRVDELGELLGATDLMDQPVRNLSLGQRMRCELAACLLHDPEILFLDEPTIGLDLVAKQRFRELLVRLNEQQGTTIFLTSHDVADIEHVAQRAVVINHGEVIYDDEVVAMRRALLATKIVEVGLTAPIDVQVRDGVRLLEHTDRTMKLVVETARTDIRTVLDDLLGPAVADISVVDPPLEQVIAEIYELPGPMTITRAADDATDRRALASTTRRGLVEALRTAFHRGAIDGGGLVVAVAFYVVIVATLSGLWRVAVDANGGDLAGYSALALTWYIITSEAAIVSVNAKHIEDVGNDIAQGTVAVELLRPASVLGIRMATEVGRGLPKVAALFVAGAVLATVVSDGPPRPATLVLVVPSLVLAITANLFAQHAVAAIAFWIRDAGSIWFLYMKAVFILGGMIIPLELLPDGLQRFAMFLPFRAMAYVPARLAAGFWEPALLLEQLVWIGVLAIGASLAFRAGERRLQVVGG